MKLKGYKVLETLFTNKFHSHVRAIREVDSKKVLLKIISIKNTTPSLMALFKHQYEIFNKFEHKYILKINNLIEERDYFIIEQEHCEGILLNDIDKLGKEIDLKLILKIGIYLTEILVWLHDKNIIHGDIRPANIIISNESDDIKICSYGFENIIIGEGEIISDKEVIQNMLPYMSPEQTGRMNRTIDYRTDFYSLGIVLYELITGAVPFYSTDPMELIHSHIARTPATPSELKNKDFDSLSRIILKLLSKTAEERYQSGYGLKFDLEFCLQNIIDNGIINDFDIGINDRSDKLKIPEILYGREKEKKYLLTAFNRILKGKSELFFVSGEPGIGKTVLIQEIYKPVVEHRGFFIKGKFEQYLRDRPYSAINQAYKMLIHQILTENEEKIHEWKEKILEAVSPNGKIIIDIIPDLELIIGKQPDVPEVGPDESKNRFNIYFQKFIRLFAQKEHPLVMFLDDLQWADYASLNLIHNLISDTKPGSLLIIGTYRDQEIDASHPLSIFLDEIKKEHLPVSTISLENLVQEDIEELVIDSFKCNKSSASGLVKSIYSKTLGNPFFVKEFLKDLHTKKILKYDHEIGWHWDDDSIEKLDATDNVVELMKEKLHHLNPDTLQTLKVASCVGNRFELHFLATLYNKTLDEMVSMLQYAMEEGIIYAVGHDFYFFHDRIQEAAYLMLSEEEKSKLNYNIGNLLFEIISEDEVEEKLLYIVDHLNGGKDLIDDENEKFILAKLNLRAGNKTKSAAAYESSLNYICTGIDLIKNYGWKKYYYLMLKLYEAATESAYQCAMYEKMNYYADEVIQNSREKLDTIKVYKILIDGGLAQNSLEEVTQRAFNVLGDFNIKFPKRFKFLHIMYNVLKVKFILRDKKLEDMKKLPPLTDPIIHAILEILASSIASVYWTDAAVSSLMVCKIVLLSIKHGHSPISISIGYSAMAVTLCSLGYYERGYKIAMFCLELQEKMETTTFEGRAHFFINNWVRHWREHLSTTLKPLKLSYKLCLENGDKEYASLAAMIYCSYIVQSGKNLDLVEDEISQFVDVLKSLKHESAINIVKMFHQVILNLINQENNALFKLVGSSYDENKMVAYHENAKDGTSLAFLYFHKIFIGIYLKNYEDIEDSYEKFKPYLINVNPSWFTTATNFYYLIYLLQIYPYQNKKKKKQILKKVIRKLDKYNHWTDLAPMNHSHEYSLLKAELCRITGSDNEAIDLYDMAIEEAGNNGFVQIEALASEFAGKFWLSKGKKDFAGVYINKAFNYYLKWGANVVVNRLKNEYPEFFMSRAVQSSSVYANGDTSGDSLDISTIIKLTQTLSGEINLDNLLKEAIKIVMENAGAQRCVFMSEDEDDNKLYIQASGRVDEEIDVMQREPVDGNINLPQYLINYVCNTGENVTLDNAQLDQRFRDDPYIKEKKSKSILCASIKHKGKTAGIIYLENYLTENAFTIDRQKVLLILSTQIAISLENLRLISVEKQKAVLENEIELAGNIQKTLLPGKLPELNNLSFAYKYVPMLGVGGDFTDYYYDEKNNCLGLFVCDVSGHGIYAAFLSSMVKTALHDWSDFIKEPAKGLKRLRDILVATIKEQFITAIMCCVELDSGKIIWAKAGHPSPVLIRQGEDPELIVSEGALIHTLFNPAYEEVQVDLKKGDRFILYTDGITETFDPDGVMLGANDDEKFCSWIKERNIESSSSEYLCTNIYEGVLKYSQKKELEDDFTVMIVEYHGAK